MSVPFPCNNSIFRRERITIRPIISYNVGAGPRACPVLTFFLRNHPRRDALQCVSTKIPVCSVPFPCNNSLFRKERITIRPIISYNVGAGPRACPVLTFFLRNHPRRDALQCVSTKIPVCSVPFPCNNSLFRKERITIRPIISYNVGAGPRACPVLTFFLRNHPRRDALQCVSTKIPVCRDNS